MPKVVRHIFGNAEQAHVSAPAFEPIIIDLSQHRAPRSSAFFDIRLWLSLALIAAFSVGGFMIFSLQQEVRRLQTATLPNAFFIEADENAPTLPPIPEKALKPQGKQLIPMLQTLPMANDETPRRADNIRIAVEPRPAEDGYSRLITRAKQAAEEQRFEAAIALYADALKARPDSRDAAYNLSALLLKKAAYFDQKGLLEDAADSYAQALAVWGEQDAMASSIRERLDWIQRKQDANKAAMAARQAALAEKPAVPLVVVEEPQAPPPAGLRVPDWPQDRLP